MSAVMKAAVVSETLKVAPPALVTYAIYVAGMSLDDWVKVGTLFYLTVQVGYLVWKWGREARKRGKRESDSNRS
jgi:hypothetical protein